SRTMPSISKQVSLLALALVATPPAVAFQCPSSSYRRAQHSTLRASDVDNGELITDRRAVINNIIAGGIFLGSAGPAHALVEGTPPPSKTKALGEEYRQGTAAMGGSVEAEVLPREAYNKLSSGVIYADISKGSGDVVKEGSKVNIQWVLRRSNGYFVDSSAVSDSVPFIFTVGDPKGAIAGLDEGVRGMKSGGTRRVLIPPRLAWMSGVDEGKPGPIPAGYGPRQQMRRVMEARIDVPGEYIFLEVKVTKVR
ncbi:hypothetical protein ACHAXR_001299, partial [Thalassiosira sp. AJA248-18]